MQIDPDALPDDAATLQLMLRTVLLQQGELAAENDKMRLLIQRLTRHQFGRRSEQLTADQLQLALEELEQTIAANQAGQDAAAAAAGLVRKPPAEAPARNNGALPAHLPRYEMVIDVEDRTCPCCGHALHAIGELRTEQLDMVPSQLRVRVTRRPRYACHGCALAAEVLVRIRELYAIEADIRGHSAEHRRAVRQDRSRPVVEALHDWLQEQVKRVSGASDLAKAMRYAIRHWPGLVVFLDDGRVEMDTNVVERAIRPNLLTRTNALFAGSDGGARHWAMAMTLIQTAKLNGIDPLAWLTDVLERIVSSKTKSHEMQTLLPWNWRPPGPVELARAA